MRRARWAAAFILLVLLGAGIGTTMAAYTATTSNGVNSFSTTIDTTPPTVTRATVAKASGGSAATVRQGGDYYVYAEVSDASGVASVTANTSSFDTGATSTALSTSGGPWTVGGQSYNYRSAVLTANTPLVTGNSYGWTLTATDTATNSTSPSYNATIETYQSVITGTSGLVSFWRLGDNPTSADSFTDTSGTTLSSHTGEVGASWTQHGVSQVTAQVSNENRVRKNGGGFAVYYASAAPASAAYAVEADVHVKSVLTNDMAGLAGRVSTSANTFYLVRYERASGGWNLLKVVNNTWTWLAQYNEAFNAGATRRVRLDMNGSAIKVYIDGVQRISVTDTGIAAAGRGAVALGDDAVSATHTDTAGMHVDNFRVYPNTGTTAADSQGTNTGTYTGGPLLNEPGALVGSFNRTVRLDGTDDWVSVADSNSLDLANSLTLEAWIKRGSTADQAIIEKGSGAYELNFTANRLTLRKPGAADIVQSTTTITDTTTWHHVVATKNGTTTKLYIDGVDVTGTVTDQTLTNSTAGFEISGDPKYNGSIDEVAVYNTALSAAAVLDHYKAGAGSG